MALLARFKMAHKLLIFSTVLALPIILLLHSVVSRYDEGIHYTRQELEGVRRLESLRQIAENVRVHQRLDYLRLKGDLRWEAQRKQAAEHIDEVLASEAAPQLAAWWQRLRMRPAASPAESVAAHQQLAAGVRELVRELGDSSGLVLDPDLDSYYLMELAVTLLPDAQATIENAATLANEEALGNPVTQSNRLQFAIYADALENSTLPQVRHAVETSLREDRDFHGVSESLQQNLPGLLRRYQTALATCVEQMRQYSQTPSSSVTAPQLAALADRAAQAGWDFQRASIVELQVLLNRRTSDLRWKQTAALGSGILCAASFLAFFALGYWLRIRAVENRASELEFQVKERTAELQERTYELQVAKEKAEEANHAKSAFLATVSHDLRTPLNGILGYVQILTKTDLTEKQQSGLDVIKQSGDHLLALINDILELSRIEAGKLELMPADVHVPSFLQGIADIIRIKAEQKGLEFVLAAARNLPEGMCADERRLRQVLLNLLDNAVKFTDRGRVVLQVENLGLNNSEARLRFEVADTGVGMSSEQVARIFQRFIQVGEIHHRTAGTGLGLAICHRLVNLMGGDIQVKSELGQGTAFSFELALPVPEAAPTQSEVELAVGYSGSRKKVLIVDDVPANRAVLTEFLSTVGFEIAEAENGEEGLKRACGWHPDVILMDGLMPVMDGLEATRRLRQLADFQTLPIIGLSASVSGSDAEAFLAAGANGFVTKPVAFARLLAEMGALMKIAWLYESGAVAETAQTAVEEELVMPPTEELALLHELAQLGLMSKIAERAEHLAALDERYRPLANRLHRLAKGFQSKAVLALIEECMVREQMNEPASND